MNHDADRPSLEGVRIGILHHARSRIVRRGYLIESIVKSWEDRGAEVVDIVGIDASVSVDVLLCHVDLSVVPEEYRRFVQRHPRVINASATDIRKRRYLDDLIGTDDASTGPVIVKSNLNHGGLPERLLGPSRTRAARLATGMLRRLRRRVGMANAIRTKSDYEIFPDRASVPTARFSDDSVVQPFRPERVGEEFILREYYFLGEVEILSTEIGSDPILTSGRQIECRVGSPPREVRAVRDRLNLEYGKIDYACPDGAVVVYDANKCVGTRVDPGEPVRRIAATLSAGIDAWI